MPKERGYAFRKHKAQILDRLAGRFEQEVPLWSQSPPNASRQILAKTPAGGIPAATGSGPYTWGSATCTRVDIDGTVGTETLTIKNIVDEAIAGDVVIKAAKIGNLYFVDVASCA